MYTFVLFDVVCDFFGDGVVVSKNLAYHFFHYVGFRRVFIWIWESNKYVF